MLSSEKAWKRYNQNAEGHNEKKRKERKGEMEKLDVQQEIMMFSGSVLMTQKTASPSKSGIPCPGRNPLGFFSSKKERSITAICKDLNL